MYPQFNLIPTFVSHPLFQIAFPIHNISFSQALRLLRLATHLESWALDLKRKALESLSIGVGGTKAAAIWDVIMGAFALRSEPVIRPYADYSGATPGEDPFSAVDPAPAIGRPFGFRCGFGPWVQTRGPHQSCFASNANRCGSSRSFPGPWSPFDSRRSR